MQSTHGQNISLAYNSEIITDRHIPTIISPFPTSDINIKA
jgi:hypothetical protein